MFSGVKYFLCAALVPLVPGSVLLRCSPNDPTTVSAPSTLTSANQPADERDGDPWRDIDDDGFPDVAELHSEDDRQAFRAWFVRIAESQFLRPSHAWNRGEQDCAGLIRFAYREALKQHDAGWQRHSGVLLDKNLPDVRRFHYPAVPVIGTRLFRTRAVRSGALRPEDFAEFASAEYLLAHNARRVGDELSAARPGDLLFFRTNANPVSPYHSMIVAGVDGAEVLLIYHTGGAAGLKRIPARVILDGPQAQWRPVPENPAFLGVYTLHILD